MPKTRSITVVLQSDMADLVRAKIASGEFATEVDVVQEGLRALAEKDLEIERWLSADVAPVYDAYRATPEMARPMDDAFAELDEFMDAAEGRPR